MTLRRRLALFLDPDLTPHEPDYGLKLGLFRDHHIAGELSRIALSLEHIDRKTKERRPRIIECAHPELHPADADVLSELAAAFAYIGTVSLTLVGQNPDLRVLAVEAVPENADLIDRNRERIRGGDRVTVIRAWAAGPNDLTGTCHYGYRHRVEEGDGYVSAHRFVGNTWVDLAEPEFSVEMPAVSLDGLMAEYGIDDLALLKIDCEGCEWAFLDTEAVGRVNVIVGEYHGGYPDRLGYQADPQARIRELLSPTHDVTFWNPEETVVGLFEAVRR